MASEYGIKYAVHILTNQFGDLPTKVCECLLRRGSLTRQTIKRFTELSDTQIKNSLLVLIQHNCVQAFFPEESDEAKGNTLYIALFSNIIHRARYPKFLKIISEEFDKKCVELLEGLLEHGRLTLKQMCDRATEKAGNTVDLDSVRQTLLQLVTARYVERCPVPEPVVPETVGGGRKKGAKSAKITEETETLEQRVIAAATPSELLRFSVGENTESDVGDKERSTSSMTVGEKRKHEALDTLELETEDEQTVAYRVNFEEFIHRLRHKACVDSVRARLDDVAAVVLSSMIEASRSEERKVKTKTSVSLSLGSIYEEVIKSEAGRNMTLDHVRAALVQLVNPPLVQASEDSYIIDFEKIIELAQVDEVESVVLKRYGKDAYRAFRLLAKAGRLLETNKIADSILGEKKETPKILYKLWKDGYLHMEKIIANGSHLLWKVDKNALWKHVLNDMFHAALNLSLRLAFELDKDKEVLLLPADKRVGALHDRFNRLKEVRLLLLSSQMMLDDAIMLFHDF